MRDPKRAAIVEEQLADLAWFAYEAAPTLCSDDAGCLQYHRFWSVVRLVELGGRMPRGLTFFAQGLSAAAQRDGKVRVLVAGAADTGVPALIVDAAHQAGLSPYVHVVDRCRTPLAQIARFAKQSGLDITTSQGDIADLGGGGFDAAVTHNVMGFNAATERRALLAAIGRALRPGGLLLSIETISDMRPPRVAKDATLLAQRVVAKLQGAGDLTDDRIAQIRDVAEAHFALNVSRLAYPERLLRDDLAAAGLLVKAIDYLRDDDATSPRSQPSTLATKDYAHIVAERSG